MGVVYRARDTRLGRDVALKRLSDPAVATDLARRHVLREARAAAALSHPGIATIFDILDTPQGLFIVMEFVPGETLAARMLGAPLAVDDALAIGEQIADALAHAHEHGVVHRDLKPANVHLTPGGKTKILDFGIAKSTGTNLDDGAPSDDLETAEGRIVGSPGYMAPEQLTGRTSDGRTDIYALGVLLFELMAGRRPYPANNMVEAAMAAVNGPTPRLIDVAPQVPRAVSDLVERAMARAPGDRFPSAAAFAAAIEDARRALGEAETHLENAVTAPHPRRAPFIAAITLTLVAAGAIYVWTRVRTTPEGPRSPVVGVLPFRNSSGKPEDAALTAGVTDAVLKRLGSVHALQIVPQDEVRDALKAAKGSPGVARALGVSFIVDGEVTRSGDSLNVAVQLIAGDGLARPVGRYSGDVAHQFDLHRRVADALAGALTGQGLIDSRQPEVAAPTSDPEAFADYSQARVFLERPDIAGSLDHAITLLQSATKRDQSFALAYAALGEAFWAKWRETNEASWAAKAQRASLDALTIDPAQPEVRLALAVMYQAVGEPARAAAEARQVLAAQPRSDSAQLVLSRLAADTGRWDEAVDAARTAVSLRPAYWRNHMQLGDALRQAGRLEEAVAAFTRLVELQPDSARGYQRLGTVLQMLGRHDDALQNYERAAQIGATPATYSNMGTLYYWRGEHAKAAAAYEQAIALAPNRPELHGNLGDVLTKMGNPSRASLSYRRAIDESEKLLAVNENDAQTLAAVAMYRAKLGQRDAAIAAIERAMQLTPHDGEVLYVRAVVHALAGNARSACDDMTRALASGKAAEEIRHADELKTLKGCAAYDAVMQPSK